MALEQGGLPERCYKGYDFDTLVNMFVEERNKPSVSVLWFTELNHRLCLCVLMYMCILYV